MNPNQQIEAWVRECRHDFFPTDRPFVTLCYAQSWDGSITIRAGASLALSGAGSTRLTHHLRSLHDGILVGIGTVLADDPQLSVRLCPGPSPQPIVLDSHLRMPAAARLCHLADKRCWIVTSRSAQEQHEAAVAGVEGSGPEIICLPGDAEGRVDLLQTLGVLRARGIASLMVEGGANVITAFLRARLVDAMVLTVVPRLVGGYKAIGELGFTEGSQLPQIEPLHTGRLDDDLIVWGRLRYHEVTP